MNVFRYRLAMLLAALVLFAAAPAWACPMCAETVAADDHLPRAYMYSIVFMLAMPAMVFTGFGIGIYRAVNKADAARDDDQFV